MAKVQNREPVRSILIDAPGRPGSRTFYLQARLSTGDLTTILLEKAQAIIIVDQIDTLLAHIARAYPAVSVMSSVTPSVMAGEPPVLHATDTVLFRAGQFALQYDVSNDLVCFQVSELRGIGQGEPQFCRWWASRQQLSALGEMTRRVVQNGLAAQME